MATNIATTNQDIEIRTLPEADVAEAARIFRLAFGTFLGAPDPLQVFGDRDFLTPRWRAGPGNVLGAYQDGRLVGSNVVSRWGSFGWFGPLTVLPELWDQGIGKALMVPTMERFEAWGTSAEGLFTFPHSPKHLGLYERYGFRTGHLTSVMARTVGTPAGPRPERFGGLAAPSAPSTLGEMRELTDAIHPGLDLTEEVRAVDELDLGDTVLLRQDGRLEGFAVCQAGAGTEGGTGTCYVKFAAVRPGAGSRDRFRGLVDAVERHAAHEGLATVEAGVSAGRVEALHELKARGYQRGIIGVAMVRPDPAVGFQGEGDLVLDDWR